MEGEPLNTSTRQAQQRGNSIYVNVTKYGEKTHSLSDSEEVAVETYEDGIFIRPINGDE
jgi:nitroimidazol reductase NimA-like FMN-containing flavoprotein (pyridoxamine 5'-phosphate oxidase superfamily)